MTTHRAYGRTLAVLGTLAGAVLLAWASTAGGGSQTVAASPAQRAPDAAARSLRDLLDRKLEETRLVERRLEEAIERLEQGAGLDQVRSIVRDVMVRPDQARPASQNAVRTTTYRAPCDEVSEDEQRIMQKVLDTVSPDLLNRMQKICTADQEQCDQHYLDLRDRLQPIIQQGLNDETMFRLRLEEIDISKQVYYQAKKIVAMERSQRSSGDDRGAARGELSELVGRQYDLRLTAKQYELLDLLNKRDKISKHITGLEASITDQAASRDDVISHQVDLAIERVGGGLPATGPTGG